MNKIALFCIATLMNIMIFSSYSLASLTKEQSEDIAAFAVNFIEEGNKRRDENGYPLLVYALSNNGNTCIEIRRSGYNGELYHVYNNNYHKRNGNYLDLGYKWCMDCGDFISYVYNITFGLDLMNHANEDPWHIKDMYADASKGVNSQFFEFIYKDVPISSIDESKLEKGDIILRMGSKENHGLIYVGENMQAAHASRNGIKYNLNPPILGFEIVQFNRFYKTSTVVSIVRVKDGIISEDKIANTTIIWPDTNEEMTLVEKQYDIVPNPTIDDFQIADNFEHRDIIDEIDNIIIEQIESENDDSLLYWVSDEIKKILIRINDSSQENVLS